MTEALGDRLELYRIRPVAMVEEMFGVKPDPAQREALEAFPHERRIAMQSPIAVDEFVYTPSGRKRWGDIGKGDVVFAEDGAPTKVTRRFDVGEQDIFRVTFSDGTSVETDAEHLWKVQSPYDRKMSAWRRLSTKALLNGGLCSPGNGQRKYSIPVQGCAQFEHADLPLDPYVFGAWLGNGVRGEPLIVTPEIGIKEEIERRGFETSFALGKRIRVLKSHERFRRTGVNDLLCYEKYIPSIYKFSSVQQRQDLMYGLMDADGTVSKKNGSYYSSTSEQLIDDIVWLARSLGNVARKSGPYDHDDGVRRLHYRASIASPENLFLAHKFRRERWRKPDRHRYTRYIASIVPAGRKVCMCISVAHNTSCFLISDFITTSNCTGSGKTACLSWIGWNFLLTRPQSIIGAASVTSGNLETNLWPELKRWRMEDKSGILQHFFEEVSGEIRHKAYPHTWLLKKRSWRQDADAAQIGEALRGLHARYVMWLLDESGGYPTAVLPTCEAIFSGDPEEAHIVQAGNPTKRTGPLFRASNNRRPAGDWYVIEITADPDNPERTPRVSLEHARQQIKEYGRESPWVLINIFGKFPPGDLDALITEDEVRAAMARYYRADEIGSAAKILGVDVARQGDDKSAIARRQGLQMFPFKTYRDLTSDQGAGLVNRAWNDWNADACFVDATGGFGWGWIDALKRLGKTAIPVGFGDDARLKDQYANRRAEMMWSFVMWLKEGGALAECSPELMASLTQTLYVFDRRGRIQIEPKEDVKKRLGYSPDEMDSAILCWADPVAARSSDPLPRRRQKEEIWNPFLEKHIDKQDDEWRS